MARKTKPEQGKPTPPASTVAAPTVPVTATAEAAASESEDSPILSEAQIGEIITRNIIGNPPAAASRAEAGGTEAGQPEPEPTAEAGQESSPAEAEGPKTEEEVPEEEQEEEPEEEQEQEEEEEPEEQATGGQRDWRQARIAKLKDRNNELRETVAELTAKVQQLEGRDGEPEAAGLPQSTVPVGHPALRELDTHIATQEQIIRWAESNPDGAEVPDGKGNQVTYDADQVRRIRADALVNHSRAVAMRESKAAEVVRDLNAEFARHHAEAAKQFPWMLKKESPEYQQASEIVKKAPSLLGLPDHELLIGYMVEGKRFLAKSARKLPAKVVAAPRVPGVPSASLPNTRVKVDPAAQALKRIQSGDGKAVQDYIAAHLNAGRAA